MKKYLIIAFCSVMLSCESNEPPSIGSSDVGSGGTGTGGSTARFTIVGDYLYILGNSELHSLSLSNPASPEHKRTIQLNREAETIFSMDDHLLLGTQSGVLFYSITDPENPKFVSVYEHIVSCDPVVAKGDFAYSTLRAESSCFRGVNQLDVINISTLTEPQHVRSIQLNNPRGLGISGDYLFICDADQLIGFDISIPDSPNLLDSELTLNACYDIIPYNGNLIVSTKFGIFQYAVESSGILTLLSSIAVE